nr:MAG TPA: hypothetical protein [Caudoviricetes sp.]
MTTFNQIRTDTTMISFINELTTGSIFLSGETFYISQRIPRLYKTNHRLVCNTNLSDYLSLYNLSF